MVNIKILNSLLGTATDFICDVTADTMGIIMAAAAVLLIHIERNHVGNMRPSIKLE
jgi:hypothetical protein